MEKNFPGAPLPSSGEGLGEREKTCWVEDFETSGGEGINVTLLFSQQKKALLQPKIYLFLQVPL